MDGEKRDSPPPLLAYTSSYVQNKKGKGKLGSSSGGGGSKQKQRGKRTTAAPTSTTNKRFRKNADPVVFDEQARHEFLTGFRKRKQARVEASKQKAKEREKEDRRKTRSEARKARKEQAAENVRMEKIAYGEGEESEDEGENVDAQRHVSPSAFETEEHQTTVTVQEWNPDEDEETEREAAKKKSSKHLLALPPSSRRAAKKLKNADKHGRRGGADARDISRLIDDGPALEVTESSVFTPTKADSNGEDNIEEKDATKKKKSKPKFHYETKMERAKARAKIREDKARFAERRREERKRINMQKGATRRKRK